MDLLARILALASEADLLRLARHLPEPPASPVAALQHLLGAPPAVGVGALLDDLDDGTLAALAVGLDLQPASAEREHLVGALRASIGEAPARLTIDVPRKKPKLAWRGMDRRMVVASVPTQVVEVVSPARSSGVEEPQPELAGLVAQGRRRGARPLPPNRLIWTNDNLVALHTLVDEKDPATGDWRYRGKVDLVYIDPPFMVNDDFYASNTVSIEVDGEVGVAALKEPSIVEMLAYRDTWREGLDSFLSMMRDRLVLLKKLLAPTGSIYVHLDWHAAHYVKVLMDEVFGYERMVNQITWKRANAHNLATAGFVRSDDTILFYTANSTFYFKDQFGPYGAAQIKRYQPDASGRLYTGRDLTFTGSGTSKGERTESWRGTLPSPGRVWGSSLEQRERWWQEGKILLKKDGTPRLDGLKTYLEETTGSPISSIWTDVDRVGNTSSERLGYPTQKPVALLERIISASCPDGGLVLDCFLGSGTTAEAAERLGRQWIGIDNGKYAIHLARKRLIQLHGQPKPPDKEQFDYPTCAQCGNIATKPRRTKSNGLFHVRPFTVENMGVYQRSAAWQAFQTERSAYRDEMIRVYGGEPVEGRRLLHGTKGQRWVHVGPLDAPVAMRQVWEIAEEARETEWKAVDVLSADHDVLREDEKLAIHARTGVQVTVRIIPRAAVDAVRQRLERQRRGEVVESMTVPAFYAPLGLALETSTEGRRVKVTLARCEIDVESFLASQRPTIPPGTDKMTPAKRTKVEAIQEKWAAREQELRAWLATARSWQSFVDFWAVDWDHGDRLDGKGRPIFDTDWQSFRGQDGSVLTFTAERLYPAPGRYEIAARVTDVFGNDGVAVATVEVK